MAKVLTESSDVHCGHLGGLSMNGVGKLRVAGSRVLTSPNVVAAGIATPDCTNTGTGTKKCTKVNSVTAGSTASRLKVEGEPVVLESLHGQTDGNPIGLLSVTDAANEKLKAV